ncbi:hypothetical protein ACFL3S_12955, partial [Gemmatimonadota bacterium]
MEIEEHFYTDDPSIGHPDVQTRHPDTDYFFLGNGFIQAAVQISRSGEATPVGLLLMDPDRFGPKRAALTCDPESGLEDTMISVRVGDSVFRPNPNEMKAEWEDRAGVPVVRVSWERGPIRVVERFFCPDHKQPRLAREVEVSLEEAGPGDPALGTIILEVELASPSGNLSHTHQAGTVTATLMHELRPQAYGEEGDEATGGSRTQVASWWAENRRPGQGITDYWNRLTTFQTTDPGLNHLFQAARNHLPTAVDHRGRMDGSIWQYNLEWVRDQAHVAEALVRLGHREKAGTMLARLLDQFVSPDGDTVDSGRRRSAADVELDQNGELLAALGTYVDWTGDLELVANRWEKIRALASFPFSDQFIHS